MNIDWLYSARATFAVNNVYSFINLSEKNTNYGDVDPEVANNAGQQISLTSAILPRSRDVSLGVFLQF